MKLEHGIYFVSAPFVTDKGKEFRLVGLPAIVLGRRTIETEEQTGEKKVESKPNRRGQITTKMVPVMERRSTVVVDVIVLLHALTDDQRWAAESCGLTAHMGLASTHTGVQEADQPADRRFVSSLPKPVAPPDPKKPA